MPSIPSRPRRPSSSDAECGAAVVEFALVSVLLVFLLFVVLQFAVYFYVRNIVAASAADGARYASSSGVADSAGGDRAKSLIGKGLGGLAAGDLSCSGRRTTDPQSGLPVSQVTCRGHLHTVFAPLAGLARVDATAQSLKEGR